MPPDQASLVWKEEQALTAELGVSLADCAEVWSEAVLAAMGGPNTKDDHRRTALALERMDRSPIMGLRFREFGRALVAGAGREPDSHGDVQ